MAQHTAPTLLTYACSLVLWDGTMDEQSDPGVGGWAGLEPMSPSVTIPRMLFDIQFAVWAHGFFYGCGVAPWAPNTSFCSSIISRMLQLPGNYAPKADHQQGALH